MTTMPAVSLSHDPFHDIRLRVKSSEAHIRSANIVLAALTEVIQSTGGLSLSTSSLTDLNIAYVGALITSLSQHDKHTGDTLGGVTYLLSFISRRIPKPLIRHHFATLIPLIRSVVTAHHENAIVVRCLCNVVAVTLSTITSASDWQHGESLALFGALLTFSADARPKVRRDAQTAMRDVVVALTQQSKPLPKPLCDVIISYVKQAAAAYNTKSINETLFVCGLLQSIITYLPPSTAAVVLEQMLSLPILSQSILFVQTMRVVTAFCAPADAEELTPTTKFTTLIERLTISLISLRPHAADIDANIEYFHALIRLYNRLPSERAISHLHEHIAQLSQTLLSPKPSVVSECAVAMIALIRMSITEDAIRMSLTAVEQAVEDIQLLLSYRYTSVWNHVFPICSAIISSVPTSQFQLIKPLIQSIDLLHQNESTRKAYESLITGTIGTAFAVHGALPVLEVLPLELPLQSDHMAVLNDSLMASRSWLLPIITTHIKHSQLAFFTKHLLPQAQLLHRLELSAAAADMNTEARAYHILRLQVWDTLTAYCFLPSDLPDSLKSTMKQLSALLTNEEYSYAHNAICKALSVLVGKFRAVVAAAAIKARAAANANGEDDEDEDVRAIREELDNLHDDSDDEEPKHSAAHSHQQDEHIQSPTEDEVVDTATANILLFMCSADDAHVNLQLLSQHSKKLLPVLFNLLSSSSIIKRDLLMESIHCFSTIADAAVVNALFGEALQKLTAQIAAMQTRNKKQSTVERERVYVLSDIIVSMIPSLTSSNLDALLQTISPSLKDVHDGAMQKRAYKMIGVICRVQTAYLLEHRQKLVDLITAATRELHTTAQKTRLDCLTSLLLHSPALIAYNVDENDNDQSPLSILPVFLGEILLALKDPSKRTRTAAYDLLTGLANQAISIDQRISAGEISADKLKHWNFTSSAVGMDSDSTTTSPVLSEYVTMLLGGVAGTSPHMQSACLMSFSHIFFAVRHNAKSLPSSLLPSLLTSLMPLLSSRSREVKKSMLGLVKVLSIVMTAAQLAPSLPALVNGLCIWGEEKKNRFQEKVKGILEILIKKSTIDVIKPLVPPPQIKLIDYVQKSVSREQKKKAEQWAQQRQNAKAASSQRQTITATTNGRNINDIEAVLADSDEETDDAAAASSHSHRSNKRHERSRPTNIRMTSESVDLLDEQQMRKAITTQKPPSSTSNDQHLNIGGRRIAQPLPVNAEGKLVLMEVDADNERSSKAGTAAAISDELTYTDHKSRKRARREGDDEGDDNGEAIETQKSESGDVQRRAVRFGDRRGTASLSGRAAVRGSNRNAPIRFGTANRPSQFIPLDPGTTHRRNRFGAIKKMRPQTNGGRHDGIGKGFSRRTETDTRSKLHLKPNKKHKG